jgi:hypothetical protein
MADSLDVQISRALKAVRKEMATISGAGTPEMKAAGRVLAVSIRKQLSVKAPAYAGPLRGSEKQKFASSPPGSPPFRRRGFLYKSVGTEVVGGVLRVGESYFTSRLLEEGVDASLPLRSGKLRKRPGGLGTRRIKIAARPFMQRAADDALPKMEGEYAVTLEKRIEGGGSAPLVR